MNRSQNNLADLLLNDDLVQKLMSAKAYSSLLLWYLTSLLDIFCRLQLIIN